jgi:hypothetical protein
MKHHRRHGKHHHHKHPKKKNDNPGFGWSVGRPQPKGEPMLEVTCTNEEKILVTINPQKSATKKPAKLDGPIVVEVQSGTGTFELQPDGVSFFAISGDDPGDTAYLVSGDADLGQGVVPISDVVTLHVEGARADSLGLAAAPPVPK